MSLYVTDTHPLLWYVTESHSKLSKVALRIFHDANSERALIYVPAVVLFELSWLYKLGRAPMREPFGQWAAVLLKQVGFDFAPLDLEVITEASYLDLRDPFDAAIVATARIKDLPLITKDRRIADAGVVEIAW